MHRGAVVPGELPGVRRPGSTTWRAPGELFPYFLMGAYWQGFVAIAYVRIRLTGPKTFLATGRSPRLFEAGGQAGLIAGLILRFFPDVYGAGFPAIESALWVRFDVRIAGMPAAGSRSPATLATIGFRRLRGRAYAEYTRSRNGLPCPMVGLSAVRSFGFLAVVLGILPANSRFIATGA